MKVHTESGSTYEINTDSKKIRRLHGSGKMRVGPDWRPYRELVAAPKVGQRLIILWPKAVPLFEDSPADAVPSTITSKVERIEP